MQGERRISLPIVLSLGGGVHLLPALLSHTKLADFLNICSETEMELGGSGHVWIGRRNSALRIAVSCNTLQCARILEKLGAK